MLHSVICLSICLLGDLVSVLVAGLPNPPTNTYQPPAAQDDKVPGSVKKRVDPEDGESTHFSSNLNMNLGHDYNYFFVNRYAI